MAEKKVVLHGEHPVPSRVEREKKEKKRENVPTTTASARTRQK